MAMAALHQRYREALAALAQAKRRTQSFSALDPLLTFDSSASDREVLPNRSKEVHGALVSVDVMNWSVDVMTWSVDDDLEHVMVWSVDVMNWS